jgi:hypothetical protein
VALDVRYRAGEEHLEIPGRGRIEFDGFGDLIARSADADDVSLSSLNSALKRLEYYHGSGRVQLNFVDIDLDHVSDDTLRAPESLGWSVETGVTGLSAVVSDEMPDIRQLEKAARPVLDRYRGELLSIKSHEDQGAWVTHFSARAPTRAKTIGYLVGFVRRLVEMFDAALRGGFESSTAADLLRSGLEDLLVGYYENEWLDAKGAPYPLDTEKGRYELAKDVATFANRSGGLIVVGAQTKSRPSGDEIRRINGCLEKDFSAGKYRAVLRKRLFPAVAGVTIEWIASPNREAGIGLIEVPPQLETNKPFLVKGSRESGPGMAFSWPIRESDGATAPTVETVHALIKAGQYVFAAETAEAQVEAMRRELDQFHDASVPAFLSGIPEAARSAGFSVAYVGNDVLFEREGEGPVSVSRETLGPPADLSQRNHVLQQLSERGLPVQRLSSGFLAPRSL